MLAKVQERLDKWDKIGSKNAKSNVSKFCDWFGQSGKQIITKYFSIDSIQDMDLFLTDMGDYVNN